MSLYRFQEIQPLQEKKQGNVQTHRKFDGWKMTNQVIKK